MFGIDIAGEFKYKFPLEQYLDCSILDYEKLRSAFAEIEPDNVVNLAGIFKSGDFRDFCSVNYFGSL